MSFKLAHRSAVTLRTIYERAERLAKRFRYDISCAAELHVALRHLYAAFLRTAAKGKSARRKLAKLTSGIAKLLKEQLKTAATANHVGKKLTPDEVELVRDRVLAYVHEVGENWGGWGLQERYLAPPRSWRAFALFFSKC